MEEKKKLLVLTGPTAVGKTKLSIELAKRVGGEIISADSMQVYRGMDIGSAKITKEEMDGVRHHLIDILEPTEEFNVTLFQRLVNDAMEGIYERGHIPILVGGTGFYIQAILYDIDFTETENETGLRRELEQKAGEMGKEYMHAWLSKIDPESAEKIPAGNVKRVIRAIEYYLQTNKPISEHNREQRKKQSPYDFYYFVLNIDRKNLYERIEKRIDLMLKDGLLEEVQRLKEAGVKSGMTSMQGLGYKEILSYLNGECSLEQAVYLIKRDTRHFAKRQLTWFRREESVIWIDKEAFGEDDIKICDYLVSRLSDSFLRKGNN